jgi:S-DNA-T family DNA segregation ATPase FtsK/SpoIIIE
MGTVLFAEPDVLVIMDGARRLRDVPGVVQILTDGPAVRVFAVCLDAQERLLPEECTTVVRCDPDGLVVRQTNSPDVTTIRPDDVSLEWCEHIARALASLRDVTPDESGGLPDAVRLLDLLAMDQPNARQLADSWARRPASTAFPIGKGFDGQVTFDLVRDGPHGLIAGTTGSGKSELLQTMVASLAAVNRPDELVFVLVDYKGGSAFHSCVRLPHTLGMVTDLDEALSLRALESLAAELRRREHMLAEVGAKDLPEYRALRSRTPELAPMPRLLLVIDEFATMARETPSFVPGLVSIAQRGRSLGVHLILATQRPAGVVTADIKANTNLRIALRVTDPGESMDVIDTQDAAHISTGTPGRALARLAHRSTLPFQTAYVGSPIDDGSGDSELPRPARVIPPPRADRLTWGGLSRPPVIEASSDAIEAPAEESGERTDLDALVDAIREAAELAECPPQPSPWLPALPPMVLLSDLDRMDAEHHVSHRGPDGISSAPYAMVDQPSLQLQHSESFDPHTVGHLFVIGAPRSGRSQLLRTLAGTLARSNSSADVHLYGIDAAGGALAVLAELPHCGAVVPRTDLERMARLIGWLGRELARRHELFAQHSVSDLTELRMTLPVPERPAHLMVFVDGWDALAAMLTDYDGGHLQAGLLELLREGAGVGIHMIMTSERALALGRVASLSESKLMLRMTDRTDFSMVGVQMSKLPTVIGAGRAWRTSDHAEVQLALLAPDASGQGQAAALREIGQQVRRRDNSLPAARRPFPIAVLPSTIAFPDVFSQIPESELKPLQGLIGIGGSELAPIMVDFGGRASTFLIAGPSGSGRSNALASLGVSLLAGGTRLVVITPRESPLRRFASHPSVFVASGYRPDPAEIQAQVAEGSGPTVILIDDVDLLGMGSPLEPVLREVVSIGRDRGIGIAYAGSAETMGSTLGGWMGEAKRSRQGILLAPQNSLEGELIGIRLAQSMVRNGIRPGRGYSTLGSAQGGIGTVVIPHTTLR